MSWEIVIGLEAHVQLSTASKIFSGSNTCFGAAANTQANVVDMALPGSLPVLNRSAVEHAIKFGLAVGANICQRSIFARKNYFYPDLPKNYQISQFEFPVIQGGSLSFFVDKEKKTVALTRAHLEEDAGKSLHDDFFLPNGAPASGIDLNRTGIPLLEIVTEPDMRSAAEALAYARKLHSLVKWLGICDGNMQEGSFRIDANISIRPYGQIEYGTRVEVKNVNSFRFLERAIQHEARRQTELLEDGGTVVQETRLYDADRNETRCMRSKEDAHDYRYFPDPDLPPLVISQALIDQVRKAMPELPAAKCARFKADYSLTDYDATQLSSDHDVAEYFEKVITKLSAVQAKLAANWIIGEVSAALNRDDLAIAQAPVPATILAQLIGYIINGTISTKMAREVFDTLWQGEHSGDVDAAISANGGVQINDNNAIGTIIDAVLVSHSNVVQEYRAGKQKAFNSIVGQIMKATRGKANPNQVNKLLRKKLDG